MAKEKVKRKLTLNSTERGRASIGNWITISPNITIISTAANETSTPPVNYPFTKNKKNL